VTVTVKAEALSLELTSAAPTPPDDYDMHVSKQLLEIFRLDEGDAEVALATSLAPQTSVKFCADLTVL
jgi:hypothetical protein